MLVLVLGGKQKLYGDMVDVDVVYVNQGTHIKHLHIYICLHDPTLVEHQMTLENMIEH